VCVRACVGEFVYVYVCVCTCVFVCVNECVCVCVRVCNKDNLSWSSSFDKQCSTICSCAVLGPRCLFVCVFVRVCFWKKK